MVWLTYGAVISTQNYELRRVGFKSWFFFSFSMSYTFVRTFLQNFFNFCLNFSPETSRFFTLHLQTEVEKTLTFHCKPLKNSSMAVRLTGKHKKRLWVQIPGSKTFVLKSLLPGIPHTYSYLDEIKQPSFRNCDLAVNNR